MTVYDVINFKIYQRLSCEDDRWEEEEGKTEIQKFEYLENKENLNK